MFMRQIYKTSVGAMIHGLLETKIDGLVLTSISSTRLFVLICKDKYLTPAQKSKLTVATSIPVLFAPDTHLCHIVFSANPSFNHCVCVFVFDTCFVHWFFVSFLVWQSFS